MRRSRILAGLLIFAATLSIAAALPIAAAEPGKGESQQRELWKGKPWKRHAIDNTSRGADGVRPMDVNGDGLPDLCVGWEEGGVIRAYLHPGHADVKKPWPHVTVGRVASPEDAVFVDVNGDSAIDIVSSCEGKTRSLFIHWAPANVDDYLRPEAWQTETLTASQEAAAWMFALPWPPTAERSARIDLIAGAKGKGAAVGRFVAPVNPKNSHAWSWQPLARANWVMSLVAVDMDSDGDDDVLFSDRKGPRRGIYWLENRPEADDETPWPRHMVGGTDREVMFLDGADLGTGAPTIFTATLDGGILVFRQSEEGKWTESEIPLPPHTGTGKSVRAADIDQNGRVDLVLSCENAQGKHGVMWLSRQADEPLEKAQWTAHPISGDEEGVKFDLLQLIDLDGDSDLDVLTCEERENLGVIWYENPTR